MATSDKLKSLVCYLKAAWIWLRSHFEKGQLPKGTLSNLYTEELKDQTYLLKEFEKHGPIVRTRMAEYMTICVLGLPRGRTLLNEHQDKLKVISFDLKPIIPKGFMREMVREDHKFYRATLVRGMHADAMALHRDYHRSIIEEELARYQSTQATQSSAKDYITTLDKIGQAILFHIFFGAEYRTTFYDDLQKTFHKLYDPQWHFYLEDHQLAALEEIKSILQTQLDQCHEPGHTAIKESILGRIHEAGALDETMLVNLIFMVETGRFAIFGLLRWTSKYAVDHPEIYDRISTDPDVFSNEQDCIAQAFVQESLRLNQIERLLRDVTKSFIFEGKLFPKGSIARICIWESHKSDDSFPDPFTFNPQRFLDRQFTLDEFAPFGVGSHRCPFGAFSIQVARLFLHCLSSNYRLEGIGNGPISRGVAHHEPAKEFSLLLHTK